MDPVIGLYLTRGPSSFFRRVGAVPSTIIISQNDAATTKDLWKRSLSLSLEASSWRKLGHFIEDKATSSGLKFTQASIPPSSGFFSFSAENPTKTPTLNQSTLSLSRFIAWLIFRDGFISLKIFATRHCSTIELIPGNGRDFFFLIWRLLDSNIESISDSFTGSIPLLRFIEAWLIHRMNSSSLTFMLIAGNARDFCRCVSLSFR